MSDYQQVSIVTAGEELNRLHAGIESKMRSTVQDAIRAGEILDRIKNQLKHGDFLPWIKSNCCFGQATAYKYLGVFNYQSKIISSVNLQEAYKQVETLEAQARSSQEQQARLRIAEFTKTGQKPEGWRRGTDDKLAQEEIERDKRIKAEQERIKLESAKKEQTAQESKQEYDRLFNDAMKYVENATTSITKRMAFKERIRLSHEGVNDSFIDALMDYLDELDDDSRRIEACYNIIKVCKGIANDLQAGRK
jgi:hypothetical protein